jgi:hypothetical protein
MRVPAGVFVAFAIGGLLGAVLVPLLRARGPLTSADSWSNGPAPASASGHAIVVAELFTSEGCSSCAPADAVLSTLIREQPLPSVEVVGLGEHVDYWDYLGWRDPFSSSAFSSRQSEYGARVFKSSSIYTPQLVIDGQYEAVGSDIAAIRKAIVRAANAPKAQVIVVASPSDDARQVAVRVQIVQQPRAVLHDRADVLVAITQDRLVDEVARGENRGRHLAHSAVVRSLTAIGSVAGPGSAFTGTVSLPVAAPWKTSDIRVVAFLQERGSRRILGAGSATIDHPSLKETTR